MNNERGKGPQQIGEALGDLDKSLARLKAAHDAQRQKRIEAAARPGESWEQAAARLREEEARAERERSSGSVKSPPPRIKHPQAAEGGRTVRLLCPDAL